MAENDKDTAATDAVAVVETTSARATDESMTLTASFEPLTEAMEKELGAAADRRKCEAQRVLDHSPEFLRELSKLSEKYGLVLVEGPYESSVTLERRKNAAGSYRAYTGRSGDIVYVGWVAGPDLRAG